MYITVGSPTTDVVGRYAPRGSPEGIPPPLRCFAADDDLAIASLPTSSLLNRFPPRASIDAAS